LSSAGGLIICSILTTASLMNLMSMQNPTAYIKQWLGLCGIKPDSRLLFDYLDNIAREVRRTLVQDIENLERNRRQTSGFLSVWNTNSMKTNIVFNTGISRCGGRSTSCFGCRYGSRNGAFPDRNG
jgi:hypothetical protein